MTRQEEIKTLLQKRRRRLQALKEKEAVYGYSTDPSILLEIEDIEAEIKHLQAELQQLESVAAALPAQPQQTPPPTRQNWPAAPEALALQEAMQRRSLALFIGADLPQTVTGLPSRRDLAHQLARRHGLDQSLSLAEVAQRVSQAGHRWEFTNFLRTALDTASKAPQPFHQRLAALVKAHQIETIITTAYDNLLELAFQQAGLGFNRVVRGSDVNFIDPGRPTLIKLYGDLQQPDTLVVTDQDHSALLRDREREAIIDELRGCFRRTTLLFLGYDLTDPDFRFLFDQIAESRFARQAYAVWPGLPKDDVRMWQDRGIVILEADAFELLGAWRESFGPLTSSHQVAKKPYIVEKTVLPKRSRDEAVAIQNHIEQTMTGADKDRIEAIKALRSHGAIEAVPTLIELMAYVTNPEQPRKTMAVRNSARDALTYLGQTNRQLIVDITRELLQDRTQHRYIRRRTVDILGVLKATEAFADLITAAKESDMHLRRAVAKALGRLKDPAALPTLQQLANDPAKIVRQEADKSLKIIQTLAHVPSVVFDPSVKNETPPQKWSDANIMDPDRFVEQQEVSGFIKALIGFANTFPVAEDRRNILTGCGIEAHFFGNLKLDANPVALANTLLAKFREYRVSTTRLDYHPLVSFLDFVMSTGPENYGLNEQQAALSAVILTRGRENLKALAVRSAVGRIESPEGTGIGTGVLVGPNLLLTCRHVLSPVEQASVRFDYKEGSYGLEDVFDLDLNFVAAGTQNQLDYSLVRIKGQPKPKPIRPINRILSAGDEIHLRVIHHPEGQPVVISGVGQIVQVGEDYIDHTLQTAKGSSGAPIFDQNWDLIAIHRGDTRMGRTPSPNTTEGLPIYAIWEQISPHLT